MFYPWTADALPHPPNGWGLAIFRGKSEGFICATCKQHIWILQPYLYSYEPTGTVILHNNEECYKGIVNAAQD